MEAQKPNILVVDDRVGMREGCCRALTSQGFRVSAAEHGVEGLHKLRGEPFALVLIDAMMPGMSGLELLRAIQEYNPDIICMMNTGYATLDLAAQAMEQGAHDFLPKGFSLDEPSAVVKANGLPIVDRIVRFHDGTIQMDSAPGEGTVSTVRLPVASSDAGG